MKRDKFLQLSEKMTTMRTKLLKEKGEAYSGNDDAFENFKRNGERHGLSKYQIWSVYFGKHIDAITNAIKANPEQPVDNSEGLLGRIEDAQNYLDLLLGMLVEDDILGTKAASRLGAANSDYFTKPQEK